MLLSLAVFKQVLFVGYFGGIGHQPRYLGAGVASLGLGCFVMSLTHFVTPGYAPLSATSLTCDLEGKNLSSQVYRRTEATMEMKNFND